MLKCKLVHMDVFLLMQALIEDLVGEASAKAVPILRLRGGPEILPLAHAL